MILILTYFIHATFSHIKGKLWSFSPLLALWSNVLTNGSLFFLVITHIVTNKGREDEDCKLLNMNVVFKNPFIRFMNVL